jgi:putative heavy-metal-binding protein
MPETLLTTTTFSIEGYRITEYTGLVRGIIVRSPTIGQGFFCGGSPIREFGGRPPRVGHRGSVLWHCGRHSTWVSGDRGLMSAPR